jgi:HAMP domain-containing protein
VCGAIVVAVSYALVARLPAGQGQGKDRQPSPPGAVSPGFVSLCGKERLIAHPDQGVLAKCASYYQLQGLQQGAQDQRDLTLSHLLQYSLITLAVVIALAAILGWIFSGRALRPVHLITTAARAASEHNLSARVAPTGPRDELRELAETFDEMLGRLEAAFEGQQRRSAAGRTPHREPDRQRGPLQRRGRRHLDQHPRRGGRQRAHRCQHRPGDQPSRRRPHLPAVPAAQRPHVP